MKKCLSILILLFFCHSVVFAVGENPSSKKVKDPQTQDYIATPVSISSASSEGEWSEWQSSECYHSLEYRVRYKRPSTLSKNAFEWQLEIKNNYNSTVHFNWQLTEANKINVKTSQRSRLENGDFTGRSYYLNAKPGTDVLVWINKVRFTEFDLGPYQKCAELVY